MAKFYLTRHSKTDYLEYDRILSSDNPHAPFDHTKQELNDLSEEGIDHAEHSAQQFFEKLDPKTDQLFFLSSNEARAIATADIYRRTAHQQNFTVIPHPASGSPLAAKLAGNEIQVIDELSVNPQDTLLFHAYSRGDFGPEYWKNEDPEFMKKWQQARAIINADNRGGWGANFLAHSREVEKIFPQIESMDKYYQTNLQAILKLVKKLHHQFADTNVKVLAFGHEDYLVRMLQELFDQEGIKHCETISFDISPENPDEIIVSSRGKINSISAST